MDFTAQTIALLLLAGLVVGLLPGTVTDRRGLRLAGDIGLGVAAVFLAAWLAVKVVGFLFKIGLVLVAFAALYWLAAPHLSLPMPWL